MEVFVLYNKERIVLGLFLLLAFLCMLCGVFIVSQAETETLPDSEGLVSIVQEEGVIVQKDGISDVPGKAVPSITVDDLYQIVSPFMEKSEFPIDLYECECIRIDLNTEVIPTGDVIEGEFFFPALPSTLDLVFLYDGCHLIPARWHWTDENRIYVAFTVEDIAKLDGTVGLYIFLFACQGT